MFKHYLITRFNVILNNPTLELDKEGKETQTDAWLESRFDLFERYTLPSIKNQTCKNFTWIVLFYSGTPERYRAKIASYSAQVPQFTALFVDAGEDSTDRAKEFIKSDCSTEFIITSRIDNDDLIHREYLSRIQEVFEPRDNIFLCFRSGAQYTERGCVMRSFNYIKNHYFSRIELLTNLQTALCNHTTIHKLGELQIFDDRYMWIEIVHSSNLCNRERSLMQITIDDTAELFGTELKQSPVQRLSLSYLSGVIAYYCKIAIESLKYGSLRWQKSN